MDCLSSASLLSLAQTRSVRARMPRSTRAPSHGEPSCPKPGKVDVVFMGVHGMDPERGFTTPNLSEGETNSAFMVTARKLVVVADHTKWDVVGLASIANLHEADVL